MIPVHIVFITVLFHCYCLSIFAEPTQKNSYRVLYNRYKAQLPYIKKSNPKILIFFFGTPGMGKSTIAKLLQNTFFGLIISSDGIRDVTEECGLNASQAFGFSKYLISHLMRNSKNHFFIIDRSIDRSAKSWKYFAKAHGYKTFYIRLTAFRDEVEERIQARGREVQKLLSGIERSFARYNLSAAKYPADCVVNILDKQSIKKMLLLLKKRLRS